MSSIRKGRNFSKKSFKTKERRRKNIKKLSKRKGDGPGWWRERERHSEAAKKGHRTRLSKRRTVPRAVVFPVQQRIRNAFEEKGYYNVKARDFWQLVYSQIPPEIRYTIPLAKLILQYESGRISENTLRKELEKLGREYVADRISGNTKIPKKYVKPCTDAFIDYGLQGLKGILGS